MRKSGFTRGSENVNTPSEEEVVLTLTKGGEIRGRVLTDPQVALKELQVFALTKDGRWRSSGGGQPTGEFEMTVPVGTYTVMATADGYAPGKSTAVTVTTGETIEGIEIELTRGERIAGVVVDKTTGEVVINATVARASTGMSDNYLENLRSSSATTDAEGRFELEDLPSEPISVRVTHPDYAPTRLSGIRVPADGVRLELGSGGVLRVTVTRQGQPVRGVQIHVSNRGMGTRFWKNENTDENGQVELKSLATGEYHVNAQMVKGGASSGSHQKRVATVRDGDTTAIVFDLKQGVIVTGTIRGGGQPLNGGNLVAMGTRDGFSGARGTIDANGRYSIELPGPGEYSLMISSGNDNRGRTLVRLSVPHGQSKMAVDYDLPLGEIIGVVVDATTGAPIQNVWIVVARSDTRLSSMGSMLKSAAGQSGTDAAGVFRIENLAPGSYTLRLFSGQHAQATVDDVRVTDGGRTDAGEIPVGTGADVSVRVMTEDGKLVAEAMAILHETNGDVVISMRSQMSTAEGVLEILSVEPGAYRLTVAHKSYAASSVPLGVDGNTGGPTVVLGPGGNLDVEVSDPRGNAVDGSEVFLVDSSGFNVLEANVNFRSDGVQTNFTDSTGKFTSGPVQAGRYRVYAEHEGRRSTEYDVEIVRDSTVGIAFALGAK